MLTGFFFRALPEFVFCGIWSDLRFVGAILKLRENPNTIDPVGAFFRDLLQRLCRHLALGNMFPNLRPSVTPSHLRLSATSFCLGVAFSGSRPDDRMVPARLAVCSANGHPHIYSSGPRATAVLHLLLPPLIGACIRQPLSAEVRDVYRIPKRPLAKTSRASSNSWIFARNVLRNAAAYAPLIFISACERHQLHRCAHRPSLKLGPRWNVVTVPIFGRHLDRRLPSAATCLAQQIDAKHRHSASRTRYRLRNIRF